MSDTVVAIITCLLFFGLGYIHGYDEGIAGKGNKKHVK